MAKEFSVRKLTGDIVQSKCQLRQQKIAQVLEYYGQVARDLESKKFLPLSGEDCAVDVDNSLSVGEFLLQYKQDVVKEVNSDIPEDIDPIEHGAQMGLLLNRIFSLLSYFHNLDIPEECYVDDDIVCAAVRECMLLQHQHEMEAMQEQLSEVTGDNESEKTEH